LINPAKTELCNDTFIKQEKNTIFIMDEEKESDVTAIKEMLNQFVIGCNTGDLNLWISLWADNGIQMPPNTPPRIGKEQILEKSKPTFDQMNLDMDICSLDEVKVHGSLGFVRCTYTLKITPKVGGETINAMSDGKALTLVEKQSDGSWKIIYDCFNSNVPPT
jgi:uncharacterized protein (TIGR02246 family)